MAVNPGADPCPNCGATNLRWRNRRFYDVLFTRIAEALYNSAYWSDDGAAWLYQLTPEFDGKFVRCETPARFWRCPDCLHRGEQFDLPQTPEEAAIPVEEQEADGVRALVGAVR